MKKRHYISFSIPREDGERIRQSLVVIECHSGWRPPPNERGRPSYENTFDSDDPRLQAVLELVCREQLRLFERVEHHYSDAELRSFPLLRLSCNRATVDGDYPGHGTEYDFATACPSCGCGAAQTSPLMIPGSDLPKSDKALITHTHEGHILVGEAVVKTMERDGITGVEFRQVCSSRSRKSLPWWQVFSTFEMPPMTRQSRMLGPNPGDSSCPVCKRDESAWTLRDPQEYGYHRCDVDPAAIPDVVRTWECFGPSYIKGVPPGQKLQGIAPPQILVKPRVFNLFRLLNVRGACFEPVRIQ